MWDNVWEPEHKTKIYEMLKEIDRVLGDGYAVCWGSLLGQYLHGDALPWDDDVDLLLLRPVTLDELKKLLPDYGVVERRYEHTKATLIKVFRKDDQRIPGQNYAWPFIDLAPTTPAGNRYLLHRGTACDDYWPLSLLLPVQRAMFGPVEVNIPAKPKDLLLYKYGPRSLSEAVPSRWNHRQECATGYPQVRRPLREVLPGLRPMDAT